MNPLFARHPARHLLATTALTLLLLATPRASAGPGAHGPNGEHLDSPTPQRAAAARPRVEAKTEAFELVGTLHADGLSVLIDRYETNEPVLGASLEVDSGGIQAKATFHADQGHYAIDDPRMLALLRSPGEHGLVFTLVAGQDSDLLDGTLVGTAGAVAAAAKDDPGDPHGGDGHGHDQELERAAWIGAGITALGLVGGIAWWRQRRREAANPQGSL